MGYFIGIDLGTSSVKGILTDKRGTVLAGKTEEYPVLSPQDGWSEQNPEDWYRSTWKVLRELSSGREQSVEGVCFCGQMHGLVALDESDRVIRPCILWNDGRTAEETRFLNEKIGTDELRRLTANIAFAGFTAPKLLWMKRHEPENFKRIAKIMLPKDYLVYRFTGEFCTDCSDASGTLLFDVKNRCWSEKMCGICSVEAEWLPAIRESFQPVGRMKAEYGLPAAVVAAGAGDNAAAAIGAGTVREGECNLSLGTSGTVFLPRETFALGENAALHCFANANGKWHQMGCILSAASCQKWWIEEILRRTEYFAEPQEKLGDGNVYFLPYLMGERCPHNDVNARGVFLGMRSDTTQEEMSLSVLEGVTFALRECAELAANGGAGIRTACLCGGGSKNLLWRQIIADVLNVEVCMTETTEGVSFGAAILAMVSAGKYAAIEEAVEKIVRHKTVALPNAEAVRRYERKYCIYRSLYPALKGCFERINQI